MKCIGFEALLVLIYVVFLLSNCANASTFTIANKCGFTVWPGLLSGARTPQLPTTGFVLRPGESSDVSLQPSWSGRIWGRTSCSQDPATGKFSCGTGDCGSSALECSGSGAAPPAPLAEFTLNGAGGLDFYNVSLVYGYNLPMLIEPRTQQGQVESRAGICTATGTCGGSPDYIITFCTSASNSVKAAELTQVPPS